MEIRLLRGHEKDRFLSRVEKTDSCWLWAERALKPNGYGAFTMHGKACSAHRASYLLFVGPIPEGAHVLHACDVKRCVNPSHLYLGDHAKNMEDRDSRGRQARGSRDGMHKLCEADIVEIRAAAGFVGRRRLSELFGVSHRNISHIINRVTWRHVADQHVRPAAHPALALA